MTFSKIIHLFDRQSERQVRQLALAAEAKVHRLSGMLPPILRSGTGSNGDFDLRK
jgi:hypothetical protein